MELHALPPPCVLCALAMYNVYTCTEYIHVAGIFRVECFFVVGAILQKIYIIYTVHVQYGSATRYKAFVFRTRLARV